jgi:hypothetical protein
MDTCKVPEVPESPGGVGLQEARGVRELAGSGLEVVRVPSDLLQQKPHWVWLACQASRPWHMGQCIPGGVCPSQCQWSSQSAQPLWEACGTSWPFGRPFSQRSLVACVTHASRVRALLCGDQNYNAQRPDCR